METYLPFSTDAAHPLPGHPPGGALFLLDMRGHICSWSEAAEALTGFNAEAVFGRHYRFLFPDAGQASPDTFLLGSGVEKRQPLHTLCRRADNSSFRAHVSVGALPDAATRPGYSVYLFAARTDGAMQQKQGEQPGWSQLLERTRALEHARDLGNMKAQFVALAAHEFRTPLSTILSSVDLMEHYLQPQQYAQRQRHLNRIRTAIAGLTGMLDDLLALDRLEQHSMGIRPETLQPEAFLRTVLNEVQVAADSKNQQLLLACSGTGIFRQDAALLRSILLPLVWNAHKYSPPGCRIWIDASAEEAALRLQVKDEGIGIPEAARAQVFELFFRAPNALYCQGAGLGLSIVQRYVSLLGGIVDFESTEGTGSTFRVWLPALEAAPAPG